MGTRQAELPGDRRRLEAGFERREHQPFLSGRHWSRSSARSPSRRLAVRTAATAALGGNRVPQPVQLRVVEMAKRPGQIGGKRVRHRPPGVCGARSRTATPPAGLASGLRHRFVHPPALRGARPQGVMPLGRLQRNSAGLANPPGDCCRPPRARADRSASLVEVAAETCRAAERGVWPEAGAAGRRPGEGVPAISHHRHNGGGTMSTAIAIPGNTADTFLVHFFGGGLADDRYVVERFRSRPKAGWCCCARRSAGSG